MTNKANLDDAPEGFVAHVLENIVDASCTTEENLRAVIDETWRRAQLDDSKDLQTSIERYIDTDFLISRKVARVQQVIRNTLHKRNLEAPERFLWATGRGECRVVGFYRNESRSYQNPRYVAIAHKPHAVSQIKVDLTNDFVGVKTNSKETIIPLSWLSLSDGDLSKMVRNEIRAQVDKKRQERLGVLRREKALVETNLNKLLKELADLESANKKP